MLLEQKLLLDEGGRGFQKPQRGAQSPSHDISCFLGTFVGFRRSEAPLGSSQGCVVCLSFGNSVFGMPTPGPLLATCLLSGSSSASQFPPL